MRTELRSLVVLALASTTTASQSPRRATVRDSAGIRIVENGPLANLPVAIRVDSAYTLDLGGLRTNPDEELDSKTPFYDVARLSDGKFVAVDYASLKLFAPDGRYLATLGRAGAGPGEFHQARGVCVTPGDTIIALHYGAPTISVFDKTGRHIRTVTVRGLVQANGCFADGTLAAGSVMTAIVNPRTRMPAASAALFDRVIPTERIRSDGTSIGAIGLFPRESGEHMFQDIGNFVVAADRIISGNGATAEYRVHSSVGKLLQIVRWAAPPQPVTRGLLETQARSHIPLNTPPQEAARRVEQDLLRSHRETLPFYSLIRAEPNGRVWVQDPFVANTTLGWTVFDATGQLLGRAAMPALPAKSRPEIGGWLPGQVVLGWRDNDGVAHRTFHRVRP
jgi:hypothetical protein